MSLVAVVGARSAGTTTTAVALAAAWPGGRGVVAECDPDGGCLALAAELAADPGLASLAVAARPGLTVGLLTGQLQRLGGGAPVLVGPAGPDQAAQAVAATAALLPQLADAEGASAGAARPGSCWARPTPWSWSSSRRPKGWGTPRLVWLRCRSTRTAPPCW